jgi:hypothetical protein
VAAGLLLTPSPRVGAAEDGVGIEFFEKHVRPVFVEHCYRCHSSKAEKGIKGGLNLETREGLLKGGENGPAIIPGDVDRSLLIKAVRYLDENLKMPPKDRRLSGEQVAGLEAWVKMGAPYPRTGATPAVTTPADAARSHWAYQPVKDPPVPTVKNRSQVRNSIDAFLLAKLEPKGLKLSPEADRRTLARRAAFDLTGLPPSEGEVTAFVEDRSSDAYEKMVDRLLASPRYGERWGRYWLDIARYADTKGYVFEEERRYPYSYTYRDYVIRAFNEDLPFDQFLVQQLAADLLPLGDDKRPLAGLGFLTLGRRFLNNPHDIIDDRLDVMCRGIMGLTIGCARCHDHKFDPVTMKDYYGLYGVLASSHEPEEKPLLGDASLPKEYPQYLEERKKRVEERRQYRADRDAEALLKVRSQVGDYLLAVHDGLKLGDAEAREKVVRERKLEPVVAHKFRDRYEEWRKKPTPLMSAWFAFAGIEEARFAAESGAVAAKLDATIPAGLAARVRGSNAPASLKEVAARYNDWFATAAKEFAQRTNSEAGDFFTAADSPLNLNADELHRIFDTPAQQKLRALQRRIDELDATHPGAPPRAMALRENGEPHRPHVFKRGNPGNVGDEVPRQFIEVLSHGKPAPFTQGSGRLELARAIASRDNPLTARVWANRAWNYHFGAPFVRTPSDFGLRSDPPTNPELLDHLAARFMADGWSVKRLHRMILLSSAYRQSSDDNPAGLKADPANQLLWRQNRRRLDFEAMRDTLLFTSGALDLTQGGHPVDITTEPFTHRRTVYGFVERQNLPGLFRTFDFASPDTTSPQRFSTTVPQQALFLMNSPFVTEQARRLVERPEIESARSDEERVRRLYAILYQRRPEADEMRLARDFLQQPVSTPIAVTPSWQYGYGGVDATSGRVTSFTHLPHFNNYRWQGGKELPDPKIGWVLLNAEGGHPGGDSAHAAIRRWTAPRDGVVSFKGDLEHPSDQGDGVRCRLVLGREGTLATWTARHSKTNTTLEKVRVKAGDTLDLVTDCQANEGFDSFVWTARFKYTGPESGEKTEVRMRWHTKEDFSGPTPQKQKPLGVWERYAQALLLSNELVFVD